jgi:hypothetical protein
MNTHAFNGATLSIYSKSPLPCGDYYDSIEAYGGFKTGDFVAFYIELKLYDSINNNSRNFQFMRGRK